MPLFVSCEMQGNIRTITFPDGSKYVGEMQDSLKQGYGKMTWANGDSYEGQWFADKIQGNGVFTWANGDTYNGQWVDNRRQGQGTMTEKKRGRVHRPVGSEQAERAGHLQRNPAACPITGSWSNDRKNGNGVFKWPDGSHYEGEWKDDKRSGQGVMTSADGKTVEKGMFLNDLFVGK